MLWYRGMKDILTHMHTIVIVPVHILFMIDLTVKFARKQLYHLTLCYRLHDIIISVRIILVLSFLNNYILGVSAQQ